MQIASETLSKTANIIPLSEPKPKPAAIAKKGRPSMSENRSLKRLSIFSPILPNFVLRELMGHPSSLLPKKRSDLLVNISKYWSLKKESRRGAMLLKRLHLEPWTANATASKEDDAVKAQKYQVVSLAFFDGCSDVFKLGRYCPCFERTSIELEQSWTLFGEGSVRN